MNITEDTTVYLVHYWPGSCGAFIAHLINSLIAGKDTIKNISANGNVHDSAILTETNNYHVIHNHGINHPEELYKTHTKRKSIVIQVYEKDLPLVHANFFYKAVTDSYHTSDWLQDHWNFYKDVYFDGIKDPRLATPEMVIRYINGDLWPVDDIKKFAVDVEISPEFYLINFRDIYLDKDKIIKQLCEITGTSTNINTLKMYDKYLEQQHIQEKINFIWR